MDEIEFQKSLPKIREILHFVLETPYSDFYRKKYAGLDIDPEKIETYEDFCKIPKLTKDELLDMPLEKRLCVPKENIARYSISSGTTTHNQPLILPHIRKEFGSKSSTSHSVNEAELISLGVDKIFGLQPAQSVLMSVITDPNRKLPIILPDIHKMDLAAVLAKELHIEAIVSSPTILYFFTEILKKTDFDRSRVKWISMGSEFCTTQKFNYFKDSYPNAKVKVRFGSSESGGTIGFRCEYRQDDPPQIFHPTELHFLEVDKGENSTDGYGEMVFTHLKRDAFPLIRYRTNDFAKLQPFECECGRKWILDTGGKKDMDVLKTSGVVLHTQAIADAVEGVSEYVQNDFQLHVYEVTQDKSIRTRLVLYLVPKTNDYNKSSITEFIQNHLQISVDKTLADAVNSNLFTPLEVQFVDKIEKDIKSKNIISHLSAT